MITKEQWKEIQNELASDYGAVKFSIETNVIQHMVTLIRSRSGEGIRDLFVFIDEKISAGYAHEEHELFPIASQCFRKCSKPYYTPAAIKRLERDLGKRDAKKYFPKIHDCHIYYMPSFRKAEMVVRQYKKIAGLKLVCIGRAVYEGDSL